MKTATVREADQATAISIVGCSRCGGRHDNVVAKKFLRPPGRWDAWAMCPQTLEPILVESNP